MLTTDEARTVAERWQPRFANADDYLTSVERYLAKVPAPARSESGLDRWLASDADQEGVRSVLLAPRTPRPELAPQNLPDVVDDCPTCRGKRLVRRDLPVGHVDFGKALRCPTCNGHPLPAEVAERLSRPPILPAANQCFKCGKLEDEPAGDRCANPRWHLPNAGDAAPPGTLGAILERVYRDSRQRCDDCGVFDDEPGLDSCPRSFWHLPDVWLALHPGSTLTDMGSLGPFMRGFLRRQRPVAD